MTSPSDASLGIHSYRGLAALGHTRHAIGNAVDTGALTRIRPGWFAAPDAHPDAIDAVRVGGILTATSGSRPRGLWTFDDDKLHVLVARNASRLGLEAVSKAGRPVCVHWAKSAIDREVLVAPPLQLLVDSARCQPRITTVAMADSALNKRLITVEELETALPRLARWCDPAAQSGTESTVRSGLTSLGVRVRIQVRIAGVGRVDVVVGDRLVIECDSAEFHDGYQSSKDYERDQELMRRGYLVLRLTYRDVVYDWDRVEALVLEIVRARRHLWRTGSDACGTVRGL